MFYTTSGRDVEGECVGETLKKRSIIKNQNRVCDGIFRGVSVIGSGCEVRKRKK